MASVKLSLASYCPRDFQSQSSLIALEILQSTFHSLLQSKNNTRAPQSGCTQLLESYSGCHQFLLLGTLSGANFIGTSKKEMG